MSELTIAASGGEGGFSVYLMERGKVRMQAHGLDRDAMERRFAFYQREIRRYHEYGPGASNSGHNCP